MFLFSSTYLINYSTENDRVFRGEVAFLIERKRDFQTFSEQLRQIAVGFSFAIKS